MRQVVAAVFCGLLVPGMAAAQDASVRPPERKVVPPDVAATADKPVPVVAPVSNEAEGSTAGLRDWIAGFRATAVERGVDPALYDAALKGLSYDAEVVRRDRNQAEFTKTIWDYLGTAVSDLRIKNGRAALARQDKALVAIEEEYGVDREVIVAIWGLESAYGTFRGSDSVLSSMATLAYDGRRAAFFADQLVAALKILQEEDMDRGALVGSWAGAMGHTQFMPTSFREHAVDHDGDGRRNIWGDDPVDALASTAAYLKFHGWTHEQPWGVEVTLPDDFDYRMARRDTVKLPSEWAEEVGIVGVDGAPVADHGKASVLLPGGEGGAAFLVFDNFEVLEAYNTADSYVIGVGHLADRIAGAAPFKADWPRDLRALTFDERVELQERLTAAGFDTVKIDAKMGPLTVDAVRRFQADQGITPDGYPSLPVLERLRDL